MEFETRVIHGGQEADPRTGAVVPAIYATSTYKQDGVGGLREGYEYSRSANPTRDALQASLASIENGASGLAFASGLAAEDTLLRTVCKPGDHVVIPGDAYGGTYRLFARVLERWGLDYTPVAQQDLDGVRAAIRDTTRIVWGETPTNPLLNVADIAALAGIARDAGAHLVVDNTFASPALQRPLELGAHIVVHSTTKYLGGHSDVVGGALVTSDVELGEQLAYHQNAMGSVAGPFDAWLVLRGIKTLAVRMDRHCDNAERIVAMLRQHEAGTGAHHPDQDEVARKQMSRFGGMVSFRVRGGEQHALDICAKTRIFTLAESLGGVEPLIEHPGRMTHASAAGSPLEVPSDLVRLSVGIESAEDLLADLRTALACSGLPGFGEVPRLRHDQPRGRGDPEDAGGQCKRAAVRRLRQRAGRDRADDVRHVPGHRVRREDRPTPPFDYVTDNRTRRHIQQPGPEAEDRHRDQKTRQGRHKRQQHERRRADQAPRDQHRLAAHAVGEPAGRQQHQPVESRDAPEPDPGPDHAAMQLFLDEQRDERGAYAHRRP